MITYRLFAALLAFSLASGGTYAVERALVFGSVAMDIPAEMHKRLTPLTEYLSDKLGRPVQLHLSPNMKTAIDMLASGEVDVAYLTPVAYLDSHAQGNTRLLVKTVTQGRGAFQLMIVSREGGPISEVADLKGRNFAFGDPKALLQRAVVEDAGLALSDLSEVTYLGHYDNIARGIAAGDFDGGILKDTKAFAWAKKGLKIIHESAPLPPYNVAVRNGMDEATFQQLRQAFLALDKDNPEQARIIHALNKKYDGFASTTDAEYDVVRRLVTPFR